ncbi:hypothetical protein B0T19DRAFT_468362 [Cercophora scortea]|uniref:Uncharacterized protein n=1 Tax=Cercophora scortea TaxID=314031 RepID=A0AAE0M6A4_9PEZI|nr:hypothetical protein B0T19DRAFT_468362 [Cercophora scortea]
MSFNSSSNADELALSQTILTGVSLLAVFVAIFALGVERTRRVREYDKGHETTKPDLMGCFSNKPVGWFASLMGRRAPVLALPSIGGLIEAADRGLWSSTTLDHMPEIHPELTWIPLYESIFDDLHVLQGLNKLPSAWSQSASTRRVFVNMSRLGHAAHRSNLAVTRRGLLAKGCLAEGIRKLPGAVAGGALTKDEGKGLARLKAVWLVGKTPCIPVTREELVALSLVMGMPIAKGGDGHYAGIGAYGLSLDLAHTEANWKLTLVKGSRIPRHAPSMGGGYTSLMAKHLACGSIPFAEGGDWIRSVYVTDAVLAAVRDGVCIVDTQAYGGASLEFLRRLPADKAIDAYYGIAEDSDSQGGSDPGRILNANKQEVGSWASLVAGIAFGGLVPQADRHVVEVVRFTVSGQADGCVQNLELLVDELHGADKEAKMFGERVAERNAATGHMYVNHNFPASDKNPRDAASIFARYMNLLERVIARSEGSPVLPTGSAATGPVVEPVVEPETSRSEGDLEAQNGYAMHSLPSANGHAQGGGGGGGNNGGAVDGSESPGQPSDHVFEATVALLKRTYRAAVKARKIKAEEAKPWLIAPDTTAAHTPAELELVSQDLGTKLAEIKAALRDDRKIPLEDAATVVRCILAAWADTVPRVDVMEHLPNREDPSRPESGTGVIFMDALPSVVALS